MSEGSAQTSQLRIGWRTIAISSITTTLALAAVTAVVSTLQNADALSVVALALAVIAFIVQIIVFIVQGAMATEQDKRSLEIHSQTMVALQQISTRTEGTHQTVNQMSERVIRALVEKAQAEGRTGEGSAGPAIDSGTLARGISQYLEAGAASSSLHREREAPDYGDREMLYFPDDPRAALDSLESLESDLAVRMVQRLGRDQLSLGNAPADSVIGPGMVTINQPVELHDAGLVKRIARDGGRPVFVLTDLGKVAARILLAEDAVPEAYRDRVRIARNRIELWERKLKESRTSLESRIDDIPISE